MTLGILGGGLSGLALSHLIPDSQILEKSSRLGGLMQSATENGFTFDLSGGHILFSKNKDVMLMMLSVLGDNVCQRTRNTKILYNDRLIKYPFENGLSDLTKEENFECVSDFIKAREIGYPKRNFYEYLISTYGRSIAEKYLIPYNEKIWKYPLNKMSADWCEERMPQPTVDAVLKASLGIQSEGYLHQLHFYYPRVGGIEAFITALAKDKNISCNKEVTHIEKTIDGKWTVHIKSGQYSTYTDFDDIVSTLPLPVLISCIDDVPAKVKKAVSQLKYNSLITVMIGVDYPLGLNNPTDISDSSLSHNSKNKNYSWIYYPGKAHSYHRINFVSNFSDMVAPDGKSAMIFEITCHENDEIYNLSDVKIIDTILEQSGINGFRDVVYSKVHRTKYAYVIYDQQYYTNINIIRSFLKERGIKTLGRFAEWEYYNMDQCIEKAMAMAERIKYKL